MTGQKGQFGPFYKIANALYVILEYVQFEILNSISIPCNNF